MNRATLRVDVPLDLDTTLYSGQAFRWRQDDAGRWTGFVGSDLVRLSASAGGLTVESTLTPAGEVIERVADYLSLDVDLPAIQHRLGGDPHVAGGIAAYPGMRILRQDPWETLASFILSSTSNIPRIARTVEAIASSYGQARMLDGTTRSAFPQASVLAEVGEQALRDLGCGFRAPYLAGAASAVASGALDLDALRAGDYDTAHDALVELHGVGDKVADCAMLFSLEKPQSFPADRWVLRVVHDLYKLPERTKYDGIRQWAWDRFGDDAGYANQYLFWNVRQTTRAARASV